MPVPDGLRVIDPSATSTSSRSKPRRPRPHRLGGYPGGDDGARGAVPDAPHHGERPITVTQGTTGRGHPPPNRIIAAARGALAGQVESKRPELWDGRAAERIADVLTEGGLAADRLRPTDQPSD